MATIIIYNDNIIYYLNLLFKIKTLLKNIFKITFNVFFWHFFYFYSKF